MRIAMGVLAAIILSLIVFSTANVQITWTRHDVDVELNGAWDVDAVDLDQDGDLDLLSIGKDGDDVAWYENDGSVNFTKYLISGVFDTLRCVIAHDIDGDLDVLGCAETDAMVTWWKSNLDPVVTGCDYAAGDVNGSGGYNGLDVTCGVAYLKGGPALIPCADCPSVI